MRLAPVDFFSWLWNAVELIQFGLSVSQSVSRLTACLLHLPLKEKNKCGELFSKIGSTYWQAIVKILHHRRK